MKPKNIMLLGFINKAADYLEKHLNDEEPDTRLAELKNIDLASIRAELSDTIDSSLGTMQSTMSTLLKAGNEAFDKFIDTKISNDSLSKELNRLFDIDLDSSRLDSQDELAKLLQFYNLDNDFNLEDDYYDEENEDEVVSQADEKQETTVKFNKFDASLMKYIAENASKLKGEDVPLTLNKKDDEEIDSVFSEIVNNEDRPVKKVVKQQVKQEKPLKEEEIKETVQEETKEIVQEEIKEIVQEENKQETKETVQEENKQETKKKEIYEKISSTYKYLPKEFIKNIYELKDEFKQYKDGYNIIMLHRISFSDVENLRKFAEISMSHDYGVNVDEDKLIVDLVKEFRNTKGLILSNICEIANQAYYLCGGYEGYNVLENDR